MENFRGVYSYRNDVRPEYCHEIGSLANCIDSTDSGYTDIVTYEDNELKKEYLQGLESMSKDLVFISIDRSEDIGNIEYSKDGKGYSNIGNIAKAAEVVGRYADELKMMGYHILFLDPRRVIAFKRKIASWNSTWLDMQDYLKHIVDKNGWSVGSVVDCGTGMKGVVAQSWYDNEKKIKVGYGCDIWTIKQMDERVWKPLKMNALDLLDLEKGGLGEKSVDIVQAFGFLEHLTKEDGYKCLDVFERVARKLVIVSAAAFVHGMTCDEKAIADGNPYHRYNSIWHWKEFEGLGYVSNFEDMRKGITFSEECIAWKVMTG